MACWIPNVQLFRSFEEFETIKMFAILLCTLFLSGAIAAPYPGEDAAVDAGAVTEYVYSTTLYQKYKKNSSRINWLIWKFSFSHSISRINQTLAQEITQQASQAGVKVLTDLLDGKDLQTSLLDR